MSPRSPKAPGESSSPGCVDPVFRDLELRRALDLVREAALPRTFQAFWFTVVDGRPTRDVADELGLSEVAVRLARRRILGRLRALLG